jgi:hypothetical protein
MESVFEEQLVFYKIYKEKEKQFLAHPYRTFPEVGKANHC